MTRKGPWQRRKYHRAKPHFNSEKENGSECGLASTECSSILSDDSIASGRQMEKNMIMIEKFIDSIGAIKKNDLMTKIIDNNTNLRQKQNEMSLDPISCKEISSKDWLVVFDFVAKYMNLYTNVSGIKLERALDTTTRLSKSEDLILQKILLGVIPNTHATCDILCNQQQSGIDQFRRIRDEYCDPIDSIVVSDLLRELVNWHHSDWTEKGLRQLENKIFEFQRKLRFMSKDDKACLPETVFVQVVLSNIPLQLREQIQKVEGAHDNLNSCFSAIRYCIKKNQSVVMTPMLNTSVSPRDAEDKMLSNATESAREFINSEMVQCYDTQDDDVDSVCEEIRLSQEELPLVISTGFFVLSLVLVFYVGVY